MIELIMIMIKLIIGLFLYVPHTDNQSQYTSESACGAVNSNGQKSQDKRVAATVVIDSEVDNLDDVVDDKGDENNLFLIQSIQSIQISLISLTSLIT